MKELAEKAIHGDVDAFLELMDRNSLSMYKVARGILNQDDDVADAIQDTILKCFEKIRTLKNPEYFKTWMIRILINECNQILRHYQRVRLPGEFQETASEEMSLAEFEFKEMLNLVDEKYRVVLILYYVEGFQISEIAELLELNENTVKTRLSRAREQIRRAYLGNESKYIPMSGKADFEKETERDVPDQKGVSNEKTKRFFRVRKYTVG